MVRVLGLILADFLYQSGKHYSSLRFSPSKKLRIIYTLLLVSVGIMFMFGRVNSEGL